MALCTQDDVEKRLQVDFGNDSDPVVAWLIATAESLIADELGYHPDSTSYTERFDGGTMGIRMRRPVITVTSVTEDDTLLTVDDDYYVDPDNGIIYRVTTAAPDGFQRFFIAGFRNIEVVYDGGLSPIPESIRLVCVDLVGRMFHDGVEFDTDSTGVSTERIGDYIIEYVQDQFRRGKSYVTPHDRSIMDAHRHFAFA